MNKKDLKDGMIVELRNGEEYHILHDFLLFKNSNMYISTFKLCDYDENLKSNNDLEYDIMKVFKDADELRSIVWERNEVDWNKIPFGTKVRCWESEDKKYEGRLLDYNPNNKYPFLTYIRDSDCSDYWANCELIDDTEIITYSDIKKELDNYCGKYDINCVGCKYKREDDCRNEWYNDNFIVIRK